MPPRGGCERLWGSGLQMRWPCLRCKVPSGRRTSRRSAWNSVLLLTDAALGPRSITCEKPAGGSLRDLSAAVALADWGLDRLGP